jgi:Tetratricopeptide repeat
MYQSVLTEYEKVLGPEHTSTLDTVNNLGNLYRDQDKLDEAKQMYRRRLTEYERIFGPDHLILQRIARNLSALEK